FRGGTGVVITPPAGWTLIRRDDDGTVVGSALYWKMKTIADQGASPVWNAAPSTQLRVVLNTHRGAAGFNPIVSHAGSVVGNVAASVIPAPAAAIEVDSIAFDVFTQPSSLTWTPPAGMAEVWD